MPADAIRSVLGLAGALALTLTVPIDASAKESVQSRVDSADDFRHSGSELECVEVDYRLGSQTGCKSVSRVMRNGLGVKTENGTLIRLVIDPTLSTNLDDELCVTPLEDIDFGSGSSSRWADGVLVESDRSGDEWLRNATLQVEFSDRRDVELVWGSPESDHDRDSRSMSDEICRLRFSLDHSDSRIDLFGYHHAGTTLEIPIDGPGIYAIWSGDPDDLDLGDDDDGPGGHDTSHSRGRGKKLGHEKHHDDDDDHDDDDEDEDDD